MKLLNELLFLNKLI